jgi:hypothetical protein
MVVWDGVSATTPATPSGWTLASATGANGSGSVGSAIYYILSSAGGTTSVTVSVTGAGDIYAQISEYASGAAWVFGSSTGTAGTTAVTSITTSTITPPQANSLVCSTWGGTGNTNSDTITPSSTGPTMNVIGSNTTGATTMDFEDDYQVTTTTSTFTDAWASQSQIMGWTYATFKYTPIVSNPAIPSDDFGDFMQVIGGEDDVHGEHDNTVSMMTYDSAPVGRNQPPLQQQDDWFIEDGGDYDEPTLDTYEWSNPINPNAPPLPREDFYGADLDDTGDDWESYLDYSPVVANVVATVAQVFDDPWEWDSESEEDELVILDDVNAAIVPLNNYDDAWDWDSEQSDEDELLVLDDANLAIVPIVYGDEWDWETEATLDDDDNYSSTPVGPNAPVVAGALPDDPWDWDSEQSDEDELIILDEANLAIVPLNGYDDPPDLFDDDVDDDLIDHFTNYDQPQPILDDAWDWDSELTLEDDVDTWGDTDPVGPNAAAVAQPLPSDDGWDWNADSDEDELVILDDANRAIVPINYDDPWDWDTEQTDDDELFILDDVNAQIVPIVYGEEWDWDQETVPDGGSYDSYQQTDQQAQPGSPLLAYDDAWEWDSEYVTDGGDYDSYQQSDAAVAPGSPLLCFDDSWDWDSEYVTDGGGYDSYSQSDVAAAPPTALPYDDDSALLEDEPEDDFFDHFSNVDALQPIYSDDWDWDTEQSDEDELIVLDEANQAIVPLNNYDEAWDWNTEQSFDDDWDSTSDNASVGPNIVLLAGLGPDDAFDHNEENIADDWVDLMLDDGSNVQYPNVTPTVQHNYRRRMHRRS